MKIDIIKCRYENKIKYPIERSIGIFAVLLAIEFSIDFIYLILNSPSSIKTTKKI